MKTLSVAAITVFMTFGSVSFAQAQGSETLYSPFPDAAPHEIRVINGVPCRTILDRNSGARIPVQCAGPTATGNIPVSPPYGLPPYGFPGVVPSEIQIINGFKCRMEFIEETGERLPVECVR
ncbi:hypothetical protein AB4097_16990 [Microvirga sp. 2MCAF35]|uniref:hypothetical protein n=1 Tax=Microvirga sp. 2MCAF35 TaxID=3232987 RepID=UPI003F9C4405